MGRKTVDTELQERLYTCKMAVDNMQRFAAVGKKQERPIQTAGIPQGTYSLHKYAHNALRCIKNVQTNYMAIT